jgi:class 3 adenylate cyclase
MKQFHRPRMGFFLHTAEIVYALLVLAWFAIPLFAGAHGVLVPPLLPLAFLGQTGGEIFGFLLVTCIVFPIPVLCLFKIAAAFLEPKAPSLSDPTRVVPIVLDILLSALVLATLVIHLVSSAGGTSYFQELSVLPWAVFALSILANAFSLTFLIATLNRRNAAYQEYREFSRKTEPRGKRLLAAIRRPGIQMRLNLAFLPFTFAIIIIPAFVLMRDFNGTILASAIANGKAHAERTANAIRMIAADPAAIRDYLAAEGRKNGDSELPFLAVTFYRREGRTDSFEAEASTSKARIGKQAQKSGFALAETAYRFSRVTDAYEFVAAVPNPGIAPGYVSVEYARQVFDAPSFRIRVKVLLIAAISLYAAVFLTYLLGRNIVFPILFLRMSMNSISRTLASMIKGKTRIIPGLLQYKDRVTTHDEIKMLSNEVRGMTAVVRGIIPYISSSTLAHSEREAPKTQRKNLTLLFSDIRNFTSLCEGLTPDRIVEMLNRYLDIQAGIILSHGGDIDKFVGDEIMAMFKGPAKELSACRASIEIRSAMAAQKELAELARREIVSVGIGINSGPVVFGSVGARDRMDFTCIGDAVNLAARLEGANKNYGTKTLITEAVYEKVKTAYLCREIDLLTVMGKRQPVRIFELMQELDKASDKIHEICRVFEEGLAFYRSQKWPAAEKSFSFLKEKFQDAPSEVFLGRIALFKLAPPPRDWGGVFNLLVK